MFSLLRTRGILFLGLSNTISQLGDRLTHMVIITLIGVMFPGRISAFSEFSITFSLPIVILSPFAGVIVDHWNKQTIMFRCHMIQAGLIFITPFFIMLTRSMVPVWILVVLFFSLDLFNNTSKNSVIPDLVGYDQLVPANSVITTLARVATFVGMVGGGYLIRWVGWQAGFFIDASTHMIAGFLVLGMGTRSMFAPVRRVDFSLSKELRKSLNAFLFDLKELGILLIRDRTVVLVMISVFVIPFVSAVAYTVLIYLVQQEFGMGTPGVGLLGGIIGVGMLCGAVMIGYFGRHVGRGVILIYSIAVLVLTFLLGPFFITAVSLYIMSFVVGIVYSFIAIAQDTILQEDVSRGIRGRIFATKEFITNITFVVWAVLVGIISSILGPFMIIRFVSFVLLAVLVFSIIIYRSIPYEVRSKL
ncbi:MAG: MFS transporter [candidate division WOR-3 bacterium]|nr:MAG: MFS transporter [candidate division WOR-3 bacterium]